MRSNGWGLLVNFRRDDAKIKQLKNTKSRFIIATNVLDKERLSDDQVLSFYRRQSKIEDGFKFIKDSSFKMKGIYLKRPERIVFRKN
jgi:transposase